MPSCDWTDVTLVDDDYDDDNDDDDFFGQVMSPHHSDQMSPR